MARDPMNRLSMTDGPVVLGLSSIKIIEFLILKLQLGIPLVSSLPSG